jgi:hypothetical protein
MGTVGAHRYRDHVNAGRRTVAAVAALAAVLITGCTGGQARPSTTAGPDTPAGVEATWSPPPSVSVSAVETTPGELDLTLRTESFAFADPAAVESVPGEGHAHIYLDDLLVGMAYGGSYRLRDVRAGTHRIRVDLSSSNHGTWLVDGEPVESTITVTVRGRTRPPG